MSHMDPNIITPLPAPVPLSPVSRKIAYTNQRTNVLTLDSPPSTPPINLPSYSTTTASPAWLHRITSYMFNKLPPGVRHFIEQNTGLTLVACAQLFMVMMSLTVKYFLSTTKITPFTLIFVRMSITAIFCTLSLIFIVKDKNPILGPEGVRGLLFLRGFIGFISLLGMYQALKGLTVSDSVTIQFLAPTVTALLGFFLLGEKLSKKEIFAGFCCLTGVILVSRPTFLFGNLAEDIPPISGGGGTRLDLPPPPPGEGDMEGTQTPQRATSVAWAFVSVFGTAAAYTTIRGIGDKAHALHSIGYFSYLCTICTGLYMLIDPHPLVFVENLRDFLFIILIGIFGFCAQTLLTLGLQREKAGRAGLALYTQVIFSLVLEFLIWHTIPSSLSALGTIIILSSALWATTSKAKAAEKEREFDPEALPFSRSPSPIPPPQSNRPTLRGEHYSYESVPTSDVEAGNGGFVIGEEEMEGGSRTSSRKGSGVLLNIPPSVVMLRRGSNASEI
ncbi:uncharacterized protein I206_105661 [Kwoniella pini CBS 10737]|uniref:EamA domain-containing protein n=1 Tax=Kwoniella pini CBS 10737 TaxID=1296096 RepID=A0A1B9I3L3_9TREE|nr:uncharacterized protein I206_03437 [Kwoniella pini CBS 10737]OCF50120.1 hypothetical protein I206_03437 [Kwoniella pini CBS 10737]